MRTKDLSEFIIARDAVRVAKEKGLPRAKWTKDPILATYRFCNVHREDDRVTKWIADCWRAPMAGDPGVWFAMLAARLFNNPETLCRLGLPLGGKWNAAGWQKALDKMKAEGRRVFNPAYIVSTNGRAMEKVEYLMVHVLAPAWERRKEFGTALRDGVKLGELNTMLQELNGISGFMAGQIVADLKYTPFFPEHEISDWWSFASSGPGSRRGLNRVMEDPTDKPWREDAWIGTLEQLAIGVRKATEKKVGRLHNQDLQNCLCEFDKYERARLGEGRPKQTYTPNEEK